MIVRTTNQAGLTAIESVGDVLGAREGSESTVVGVVVAALAVGGLLGAGLMHLSMKGKRR